MRRRGTWGDLRHWELFLGRRGMLSRWCDGAPCHLARSGHPVRLTWRR